MRVLIVNEIYPPDSFGGAEVSVQLLAEGLVRQGVEVAVASQGTRDEVVEQEGVRVHRVVPRNLPRQRNAVESPLRRLVWHARDIRNAAMADRIQAVIDQERPDLVHTNVISGFSVAIWDRMLGIGLPVVHTIRDYYLLCPRATMFRDRNCEGQCRICRLFSAPKRRSSQAVRHVVGISRCVLERHRSLGWFDETQSSVIRNAVVPPDVVPSKPSEGPLRLGYLGRLHASKGVDRLMRAFADARLADAVLRIAGTGEQSEVARLRAAASGLPIEFLGHVAPTELFADCDALVVPSLWHEPLGRVVLEAYAHGVPVLGARRGGIPEIVEEGRTGWLFDPDDHDDWVAQMQVAASALRAPNQLRSQCLEAAEQVNPVRIARQYKELYGSVLGGHKP